MSKAIQHGTIGELWQGPYQSPDEAIHIAIVTLPCEEYFSEVTVELGAPTTSPPPKSALAIERFLSYFRIKSSSSNYTWSVNSNIPQSKGMASSTADVVATIKALASLHEIQLTPDHIQDILRGIERSDPVFHSHPGLYLSKHQRFVCSWDWNPNFTVIYSILPGITDTEAINEDNLLAFYQDNLKNYEDSFGLLSEGFQTASCKTIAHASTQCASTFQEFMPVKLVDELIAAAPSLNALGVIRAYTGHVTGLLYPGNDDSHSESLPTIREIFSRYNLPTLVNRAGYGTN